MSIKNRLQNLEDKLGVAVRHCECKDIQKTQWYLSDISEESDDQTPYLSGAPIPDVCPDCCKPIDKQKIILQLVDHTSKERFPELWIKG